jgi:parvulin-like peptidyl-prolyl isomerase
MACIGVVVLLFPTTSNVPMKVAVINGKTITAAEFVQELLPFVEHDDDGSFSPAEEAWFQVKTALLDDLIETQLILQEAEKEGIVVTDGEVDEYYARLAEDAAADQVTGQLHTDTMPVSEWRERLRERLVIEKMMHKIVNRAQPVDDEEIRRYYEAHHEEWASKEQCKVRQIVVSDRKTAERIIRELKKGTSFASLAQKHSITPEAADGGDLGFFAGGEMPEVFDVVFSLKVGTVSSVVKSPYGYHIFQVVEKRGGTTISLEDVREEIRERLFRERREDAFRTWLDEVKRMSTISVDHHTLRSIPPDVCRRDLQQGIRHE